MGAFRSSDCGRAAYLAERLITLRNVPYQGLRTSERRERPHDWNTAPVARREFHDPVRQVPISVVGTHGGAGTSTVAHLLNATDSGTLCPDPDEIGFPARVILTARTNAAGLMAASRALAGYSATAHPEGPYLVGFVLTADAPGRLPKPLRRRITVLSSATMVFRLPWVREWRLSEVIPDPRTEWPVVMRLRSFVERAAQVGTPVLSAQQRGE